MNVVLSILQILGWGLLILAALAVVLLLIVLLAPFSYNIKGDIHENKWVKAKAVWLFHLFRARFSYEDDLIYGEVGILWKKKTFSYEFSKGEEENDSDEMSSEEEEVSEEDKEASQENGIDKIRNTVRRIRELYPRIKKAVTDERNKRAVVHIKDEIFYLIKILLPKRSNLNAVYSTGSPDTTGQIFGVIACFPVMYRNGWILQPDFTAEEPFFKGTFWGKGRFYMVQLVGIILRIIFDKNCRRLYTIINKIIQSFKAKPSQEEK